MATKLRVYFLSLPIALLVASGCSPASNIEPEKQSELVVPDIVKTQFASDAVEVAFNRLTKDTPSYLSDTVAIPRWAVVLFNNAMEKLWRSETLERDTIFDIYRIRPSSFIDFHSFYSSEELDTVKLGPLFRQYRIKSLGLAPHEYFYKYKADSTVNTVALCNRIKEIAGFTTLIEASTTGGDGDRVEGWFEFGSIKLEYSVGYGDCMAGCIRRRFYTFRVFDDGRVEYLGARGDPPCVPGECH